MESRNPKYTPNLRLGDDDFASTAAAYAAGEEVKRTKGMLTLVIATIAIVLIVAGTTAAVLYTQDSDAVTTTPKLGINITLNPTFSPTPEPTNQPTTATPSETPTAFPTRAPTGPTTTRSPTISPTNAPIADCPDFSPECGCELVLSNKQDIIWVIDESKSVGYDNYLFMQESIWNFSKQFTFGEDAVRMGVIEYDAELTGTFTGLITNQTEFLNTAMQEYSCSPDGIGETNDCVTGTDMVIAFYELRNKLELPMNARRPDSNVVVIFISDGQPCCFVPGSCAFRCQSTQLFGITTSSYEDKITTISQLKLLAEEQEFSLIYIPIGSKNGGYGDPDTLGDTDPESEFYNGLTPENFTVTETVDFQNLFQFLDSPSFTLPLPPCSTPPPTTKGP